MRKLFYTLPVLKLSQSLIDSPILMQTASLAIATMRAMTETMNFATIFNL